MADEQRHMLVVEDNPGDVRLIREALLDARAVQPGADFRITHAARIEDALELVAAGGVELILLDLDLPDSEGLESFVRMRDAAPGVPIVVLTRTDDSSFALRAVRAGAQDYLLKADLGADALLRSLRYATERMQAERDRVQLAAAEAARAESETANRAKDEFIATVSHELRTPLNAILGWARLLRSGSLPPGKVQHALAVIERNAVVQTQLIEDLLDVSRILSGKLRLEFHTMDLVAVVRDAVDTVRPTAEARGIELAADPYDGDATVLGDADRAQQIVWNLLSNAVKFTPRGGSVRLSMCDEGEFVRVEVRDTGVGITTELMPHVFDRFRQADGAASRAHGGLGLGLAIVRHLVELHGGTVRGSSEGKGKGSTFTVRLPRQVPRMPSLAPEAPAAARPEGPRAVAPTALRGVKVLVVDDEPDARELLSAVLEKYGAEVSTAASADEAIAALRARHPNVLVSDIGMPHEDGYSLIRRVRGGDADGARAVPAVALTAYARSEDARRALAAGFQLHAAKPIEPTRLVSIVARLAGR